MSNDKHEQYFLALLMSRVYLVWKVLFRVFENSPTECTNSGYDVGVNVKLLVRLLLLFLFLALDS